MEKETYAVIIDGDIKGYVNSFQKGLDYIKEANWFNASNPYEGYLYFWDKDLRDDYPTFDDLYNILDEDQGYFYEMFNGRLEICELKNLDLEK